MMKNIAIGVLSIGATLLGRQVLVEKKRNELLKQYNADLLKDAKDLAQEVKKVRGEVKEAQRKSEELLKEIESIKAELKGEEVRDATETPKPEETVSEDKTETK